MHVIAMQKFKRVKSACIPNYNILLTWAPARLPPGYLIHQLALESVRFTIDSRNFDSLCLSFCFAQYICLQTCCGSLLTKKE